MSRYVTAISLFLGFLLNHPSLAVDASIVFKTVGPSVVLIKDAEGFGSGVVMTSDGLIVTCYHVVNTPLKQTVVAEVQHMGRRVKQEFTDVSIVGVHPTHDLALIQVKAPPGVTFVIPSKSIRQVINTGEDCFVIGNPSGASGKILENSISKGIVGSAEREIEGLKFIQVTAPINPGNSGGALCDKDGKLVGIVTFKVDQAEGLGFAIPLANTRKSDFVSPRNRKGNPEKGVRFEEAGSRWFDIARRSEGKDRDIALYFAYVCYRMSLAELPNSPSPYNNVGLMYFEMEEYDTARVFYEHAIEIEPDYPTAHHMLGIIASMQKDADRAAKHYRAGIQTKSEEAVDLQAKLKCIENLGVNFIEAQHPTEAAYLAKWALSSQPDPRRLENLNKMLQNGSVNMSDEQFTELSGKQDGFSLEDMKRFAAGQKMPSAVVAKPVSTGTATTPTIGTATPIAMGKLFETMLASAPVPEPSGLRKAIPELPRDIRPALGGAYLVMHFPAMGKLGVFNIPQAKFETYFAVPENAIYTAGGAYLLVFLPDDRIFQVYDLRTLQRTMSKPSRIIGEVTDIEMGLFNADSAMVSYADNKDALGKRRYGVLNFKTFQLTEFTDQNLRNGSYRDNIHLRPNDQFTAFTSWCTSHSPSGFIFGRMTRQGLKDYVYEHNDRGSLVLDRQSQRIYTTRGLVLGLKGDVIKEFQGASLYPVVGADFFMEVRNKQAIIRQASGYGEIAKIDLPFDFATTAWNKDNFTDDRLVHASAQLNRACFIDNKNLAVYIFSLGLGSDTKQLRQTLEGVPKGTLWTQKLNHPAGTKVNVEDAPTGVKYDPATQMLSWNIPTTQESGNLIILLSVTPPGKEESYQRINVQVR